jgi:hypothetical protein
MTKPVMTIGSDPEFLLADSEGIKSAIPVLKQDKDNPIDLQDGYKIYYDNTMFEASLPPATSKEVFRETFRTLFKKMKKVTDMEVIAMPSHDFSLEECSHPGALVSGCDPELDAYERKSYTPPDFTKGTFRSAGGHIHVGREDFGKIEEYDFNEPLLGSDSKENMVKLMDVLVGLPLTVIDNSEQSKKRKKIYGKAGRFRRTSYGIEYRTLSNYWLSSPELVDFVYELTEKSYNYLFEGKEVKEETSLKVREIINSDNEEEALKLIKELDFFDKPTIGKIVFLSQNKKSVKVSDNW